MKTKGLGIILAVYITFVGVLSYTYAQPRKEQDCAYHRWYLLTDEERASCLKQAGGPLGVSATLKAMILATALAIPTTPPWSGLATQEALYEAANHPTLVPTRPPGFIPLHYAKIERLTGARLAGGPATFSYQFFASIWHVGFVFSKEGRPQQFFVKTRRNECAITADAMFGENDDIDKDYHISSQCPRNLGQIKITGATGPTGIVSFTNALSQTGTFNLATQEWIFDE